MEHHGKRAIMGTDAYHHPKYYQLPLLAILGDGNQGNRILTEEPALSSAQRILNTSRTPKRPYIRAQMRKICS
jgi:hypothetical protein